MNKEELMELFEQIAQHAKENLGESESFLPVLFEIDDKGQITVLALAWRSHEEKVRMCQDFVNPRLKDLYQKGKLKATIFISDAHYKTLAGESEFEKFLESFTPGLLGLEPDAKEALVAMLMRPYHEPLSKRFPYDRIDEKIVFAEEIVDEGGEINLIDDWTGGTFTVKEDS